MKINSIFTSLKFLTLIALFISFQKAYGVNLFSYDFNITDLFSMTGTDQIQNPSNEPIKLRNTHYYAVLESDYAQQTKDTDILDMEDQVLVRVSAEFRKALLMEGTGKLIDGRVLNYAGKKEVETGKDVEKGGKSYQARFRFTRNPDGDGVGACALRPFKTIAIDPNKIPLGSLVKIHETVGMKLPDGSTHDGMWKADDIGGAILNDRIDLYIGIKTNNSYLYAHGIAHLQPLNVEVIKLPTQDSCVFREYSSEQ